MSNSEGFVRPRLASTADQQHPCVEDIIIEADEAWAIQGPFVMPTPLVGGEATQQSDMLRGAFQGVIFWKWAPRVLSGKFICLDMESHGFCFEHSQQMAGFAYPC
jgi:hypothetical protein